MGYVVSFLIGAATGWVFCAKSFKIGFNKIMDQMSNEDLLNFKNAIDKVDERPNK